MNDCFYGWLGCSDGCRCENYLSVNSEEGSNKLKDYEAEIEKVIKPIQIKYMKGKEK